VKRLRPWLELVRAPNLLTVPGDPLAGFALAALAAPAIAWHRALAAAFAAVCLYAAGMIWNDCADRRRDGVARPERPIPSGRVPLRRAAWAGGAAAAAGIAVAALAGPAAFAAAWALLALIAAYDFVSRRWRLTGALNMGACRGAGLMMGALAAGPLPRPAAAAPLIAAAGLTLYIAAVTRIASRETEAVRIGRIRWAPPLLAALTFTLLKPAGADPGFLSGLCAFAAVAQLVWWGSGLRGVPSPEKVGPAIGGMIRALVPFQAGLCALNPAGGTIAALLLLPAWPVAALLGRRFRSS
jgi:4-hydroxybenzoate polyprenyltransferase